MGYFRSRVFSVLLSANKNVAVLTLIIKDLFCCRLMNCQSKFEMGGIFGAFNMKGMNLCLS